MPARLKAHISMVSRVIVGFLIFAAGAGAAWYFKSIVSISEVPSATASSTRGGNRAVDIVVDKVRVGTVTDQFQAIGTAHANEAVTVTTKVAGLVRSVNFEEGQMVKRGDVLIELDDREARATLAVGTAQLRNARLLYERAQQLLKSNNIPVARVDELLSALQASESQVEAAKARLADLQIVAPFDGRLGLRRISPGSLVMQNTIITTLDDTSVIKLDFSVPETLLSKISVGSTIQTRNDVIPDRQYEGVVQTINSRVDPITRAVEIRALVPNPDGSLKPGMLMTVDLTLSERDGALLISEAALVPEGAEQYVYKVEDERAVRTLVRIGARKRGVVEIIDGLAEGDQVIVGGVQKVRNGTRVRVTRDPVAEG
jgi:membrane fusion protein (multidrug efflux system)